ncbi:MAG: hypothetical protein ABW182_10175 [Sphingomonas sp.]
MVRALLFLLFAIMPGVARAQWYEASSPHFIVYSQERPEGLTQFARNLEKYDQAVRIMRNLPNDPVPPASRLTVYVLGSVTAVGNLAGDDTVAGFYSGRASGSVAFVPRYAGADKFDLSSQQILFHEYAHHLMLSAFANSAFPSWLIEGWAEFHATATFESTGSVMFGRPPYYRAQGILLDQRSLPLARMLSGDTDKMTDTQTNVMYGRGWALVHFFTFEPARGAQFSSYIKGINEGKAPAHAMTAFGDVRTLERELDRYVGRRFMTGREVKKDALKIGEVRIRELTEGEAATMRSRMRTKRGVNEKTAPGVYAAARKAAAPYPNDPGAQIVLAETAYDAGDYAETLAACERALAVQPNSIDALLFKAKARMAIAVRDKDMSRPTWTSIRKSIIAANRVDNDHPEALILYFQSFVDSGVEPSETAKDGLYRAFTLVPQDRSLRMTAAQIFHKDGKLDVARMLLRPLAHDPHNRTMGEAATALIAMMDAEEKRKGTGDTKPTAPGAPAPAGGATPAEPTKTL